MAHKRMFSKDITGSDAFREMPQSSQALYFHLGMEADDDGFLDNYKGLMRGVNASEDDLKILLSKRFLILFPSKVIVVKHWLINNTIRHDRYTQTKYLDEKKALIVKDNLSYTEVATSGIPSGNHLATQKRIGKDRKEKKKEAVQSTAEPLINEVIKLFEDIDPKNKNYYGNTSQRKATSFLLSEYGFEEIKKRVSVLPKTNKLPYFPTITTPVQLRDKWVQLQDAADRKRSESLSGKNGLA